MAFRWVSEVLTIDKTRVALGGVSDGANYALNMGLAYGDTFNHLMIFSSGILAPFRKEGKTWRFVLVNGNNTTPLINASREARLMAVDHLPELIAKLAESSRSRVTRVHDKTLTVRALRDSLKAMTPPPSLPSEEETMGQELTAEYVHNLRVRYEGLLELVRTENERLNTALKEADKAYSDLFDTVESLLCGSQGDPNFINPEAFYKLLEVVRERAHETGDPR